MKLNKVVLVLLLLIPLSASAGNVNWSIHFDWILPPPSHGHGHGPHHCLFICWLKTAPTTNIEHLSCLHLYLPTPRIAKYNLSQRRILPHVNLIFPGKQNQMIWRDMLCGNSSNNVTCLFRHRVLFTGLGFAMFLDQKIIKALEACHSFFKTGPQ